MNELYIDKETRSPVDLRKSGLMRYARDPLTEVLMMCWAFGTEDFELWSQGQPLPARVRAHVEAGGIVVAHNAQFELALWNFVMAKRFGWPILRIEQVRCTMAASYAMALPGALEDSAHALGLKITKDTEGRALMLKMCKPRGFTTPTLSSGEESRPLYHDSPEMRARLGQYCIVDGRVEREVFKRVLPLTDREQRLWVLDQQINLRGMPFDLPSLEAALIVADKEKERLNEDMARVTGGAVTACSALPALKEWAADFGVMPDTLTKAEVNELLGEECLPDEVEAALKIRQSAGRFTSISKLKAIKVREITARVHYALQYHAATTGRWAGRGVQPHNFTRDLPEPWEVEDILASLRTGKIRWIDIAYGEPSVMISKCLRGFMHAGPDKMLMGGDFASVESRGLSWLSGEEWKLEAYREIDADPELPDMYEQVFARSFSRDPYSVTGDERKIGKVQDLAFGYAGGVGAVRTMGKAYGIRVVKTLKEYAKYIKRGEKVVTEAQADEWKFGWRDAHPKTKQYWYDLENASMHAVLNPGTITHAGALGREVTFRKHGSFLWCRLPSGRTLCYPYPEVKPEGKFGRPYLTFKGVPDAQVWAKYLGQKERGEENTTYIVDEVGNSRSWCRISTYGGKLCENITQAICRDILAEAMLRVEAGGFRIVVHVHDEIVVEGIFTEADRIRFAQLMTVVPVWATGFPISAGCWLSARYIKE